MRALRFDPFILNHEGPQVTMLRGDLGRTVEVGEAQARQTLGRPEFALTRRQREANPDRRRDLFEALHDCY